MHLINPTEHRDLKNLLHARFQSWDALKLMMRSVFGLNLEDIVKRDKLEVVIFDLLEWAEENGRADALREAALATLPQADVLDGWPAGTPPPRPIDLGDIPNPANADVFVGRDAELAQLDEAWKTGRCIVQIVDAGGSGKTTLVWHWLRSLEKDDFRDVPQVLTWSFHGQGLSQNGTGSQLFFEKAARHFAPLGLYLSENQRKFTTQMALEVARVFLRWGGLIVLDGVEPLQSSPTRSDGRLLDDGLIEFLKALRNSLGAGPRWLVVLTTRWALPELKGGNVRNVFPKPLTESEGAAILQRFTLFDDPDRKRLFFIPPAVRGDCTTAVEDEFRAASREMGNHPLALVLLAGYLLEFRRGDLSQRGAITRVDYACLPNEDVNDHVQAMIEAYVTAFTPSGNADPYGRACWQMLSLLGLFDRPVDRSLLKELRQGDAIGSVTAGLTEDLLNFAESKLRRLRIITSTAARGHDLMAIHPLIRKHFADALRKDQPGLWQLAHSRLFDIQARLEPARAEEDQLERLCQALWHGCLAGRQSNAYELYHDRLVVRVAGHDSWKRLYSHERDLAVLGNLFEDPWRTPSGRLSDEARASLLHEAAVDLSYLCRFKEAAEALGAARALWEKLGRWAEVAHECDVLATIYLTTGDVAVGLAAALDGMKLAQQSCDTYRVMSLLATSATLYHFRGDVAEAEARFRQCDELQTMVIDAEQTRRGMARFWQHCNFLLDRGRYDEVLERAEQGLQTCSRLPDVDPIDVICYNLLYGYGTFKKAMASPARLDGPSLALAAMHIDRGTNEARRLCQESGFPVCLLMRAELNLAQGEQGATRRDLDEVLSIAERYGMRRFQIDALVRYAALHLALGDRTSALADLDRAEALMKQTGYRRRAMELTALRSRANDSASGTESAPRTL